VQITLSFYNAVNDNNQYYLLVTDVRGNKWKTSTVAFTEDKRFIHQSPDPASYNGVDYSGYQVVRYIDNAVVAYGSPLPLDNQNQQLIVAWSDGWANIYSDRMGTYGPNANQACIFGINFAYPMPTDSNALSPAMAITTYGPPLTPLTSSTVVTYTSTTKYLQTGMTATASFAKLNTYCSSNLNLYNYKWSCTFPGQPTITSTRIGTISNGNNAFAFCSAGGYTPYVDPSLEFPKVTIQAVAAQAVYPVSAISTGYLVLTQYGDSSCRTPYQVITSYALGRCVQTGLYTSLVRSAVVNGTVVSFLGTTYLSKTCDPSTAGASGQAGMGIDTATTVCQANTQGGLFLTATYAKTLPQMPVGQVARYWYPDAATCASGTAAPLQARYWAQGTCSVYFGAAYRQELCAANVTLTSTTGGFVVQRYYNAAGCQTVPMVTNFNQLNVCGQISDSGSFMYVSKQAPGSSVTKFQMVQYASNDCSGSPISPSLLSVPGTYDLTNMASQGNTTIPQGDMSMVCAPSGLNNPGMAYVTVLYAPVVLAFSSGWGVARFNSKKACNAVDTTRFFSGTQYTSGCVQDATTASNYFTVAGCPGDASMGVATTVTYTYAFQGVSLATAQSAAFQTKVVQVVAAYAGVAATTVSITSVTAQAGSRRALLQSGVNVNVAIRAFQSSTVSLQNILANAGPAIVNALSVPFPGFALGLTASVPAPAPSSTAWATPGAIAGVVVGGAAAITLIVLLSIFIPRMQHYQQAQVFGHGFPQMQQQQQVPPGAFFSSAHQEESGVQVGGKEMSF